MNRLDYLAKLEKKLKTQLSKKEVNDIIRDYAEYFEEGKRQGKTDEEIAAALGSPEQVAEQILSESNMSSEEFADTIKKGIVKGSDKLSGLGKFMKGLIIIAIVIALIPLEIAGLLAVSTLAAGVLAFLAGLIVVPVGLFMLGIAVIVFGALAFAAFSGWIGSFSIAAAIAIFAFAIFLACALIILIKYVAGALVRTIRFFGRLLKNQTMGKKEASQYE